MATTMADRSLDQPAASAGTSPLAPLWSLLKALSSLRVTVALFALAIVLVLVGTLAQVNKGMWEVMDDYFLPWLTFVEFQVFFPRSWFPSWQNIPGGFPFPGGATIGLALVINLTSAHLARFGIQARGARLAAGIWLMLLGGVVTGLVIVSGHNHGGLQGAPPLSYRALWLVTQWVLLLSGVGLLTAVALPNNLARSRKWLLGVLGAAGTLLGVYLLVSGDTAYIGDAGMRVLWQLMQGFLAGLLIYVASWLLFKKRGGIVTIHLGVALLMFGQFWVAKYDVEEQITLAEGEVTNYAQDIRQIELAVVVAAGDAADRTVVIPQSLIKRSAQQEGGGLIAHAELPFDLRIIEYHENHDLRQAADDKSSAATIGLGRGFELVPQRKSSGASGDSGVDLAATVVEVRRKDGGASLGRLLLSQLLSAGGERDVVRLDDRAYEVSLRFRRNYKDYQIKLVDVTRDNYLGTMTPRSYSSDLQLTDEHGVRFEPHIWMNNPLRYRGETFYQSGYAGPPDTPVERTTLAVVTNSGWMVPYVACMVAAVGMCAHFLGVLIRFLEHHQEQSLAQTRRRWQWLPAAFAGAVVLWFGARMLPRGNPTDDYHLDEFGRLPVVDGGRVQTFDTLARNTLKTISNYETFRDGDDHRQPATRWLLDTISGKEAAQDYRVFRVDNLDVLKTLGLSRRKGFLYSVAELRAGAEKFYAAVEEARGLPPETTTVAQKKLMELDQRIRAYTRVQAAFEPPDLPPLPSPEKFHSDPNAREQLRRFAQELERFRQAMNSGQPPLAVPLASNEAAEAGRDRSWQVYSLAMLEAYYKAQLLGQQPPPAIHLLMEMLNAYRGDQRQVFNDKIAEYQQHLRVNGPAELRGSPSLTTRCVERYFGTYYAFESYINRLAPFYWTMPIYVLAFVLSVTGWLLFNRDLLRSSFALIVVAFVIHSLALLARMYISGRPPVTNLYSSAIFIAWGGVLLAGILELVFRNGLANVVASITGFVSLFIAHNLAGDGDTVGVMQAVLDTQFWLATHVVTITMGYAATFVAGLFGLLYILFGSFTHALTERSAREILRMIYGVICFAMFFSFIGTVLGGLWADDSWGRFWGWDPKENGALIIVLWNALVLHARWGRLVDNRGLAALAVGGNIVTAWSWFGVNELGVGLHAYGFREGTLRWLAVFALSQLAVIVLAYVALRRNGSRVFGGRRSETLAARPA